MLVHCQSQSTLRQTHSGTQHKPCNPVVRHCRLSRPSVAVHAAEKGEPQRIVFFQGCADPSHTTHTLLVSCLFKHALLHSQLQTEEERTSEGASSSPSTSADGVKLDKELSKITTKTAATFAPRSSTAKGKNPAQKGTVLYDIFEYQAWLALAAGGLLSFNIMFPSDEPSIARLLG
eukprot:1161180-Pelagomonas_calceolata.AAC.5